MRSPMRPYILVLVAALSGCDSILGIRDVHEPIDAPDPVPPVEVCQVCIPDDPTGDWAVVVGTTSVNDTGTTPGIFVFGDELIGTQNMFIANRLRLFSELSTVVTTIGGAGFAHVNKPSLLHPSMQSTLLEYEVFLRPRMAVLALGANDARIIAAERGTGNGYTVDELGHQASIAVQTALDTSQCVVLVTVADHVTPAEHDVVLQVNAALAGLASPHVQIADWNAFSTSHADWFVSPTDLHLSNTGEQAYANFVVDATLAAKNSGC